MISCAADLTPGNHLFGSSRARAPPPARFLPPGGATISPSNFVHPCRLRTPSETYRSPPGVHVAFPPRPRRLRRGLLLRLGIGLALCHSTSHGSGHRSGTSSLAGVSGNRANRGASRSASRRSAETSPLCLWRVCSGCLLGRLLFFLTRSLGWRSLRVYSSALLGHAVTLAFVLQLLVGTLTVLWKREHADILSRGPGWTSLLAGGRRRLPLC